MKYPFIKYVDDGDLGWAAGRAKGPFIKITRSHKNDKGLHVHELTHVKQWFRTLGFHSILYRFRGYRLRAEVEAYKAQLKHCRFCRVYFSKLLVEHYDLDLEPKEALKLLR